MKHQKSQKFINQVLPGWLYEDNYEFSDLEKIWVVWHRSVKVNIIKKSLQMITCEVLLPDATSWILVSVVYASNFVDLRKDLWQEIKDTSDYCPTTDTPWMVMGDFNQIRHPMEHSTVANENVDRKTRDFRDCLLHSGLDDLIYRGSLFTWWNKNPLNSIAKKLDRVLVNIVWASSSPSSYAKFGDRDFSDHASCGVVLQLDSVARKSPFKFYNFFLENEDFHPMICYNWFSLNVVGSAMFRVARKLKLLKKEIREFSRSNYSAIEQRVKEAHQILLHHQSVMLSDPSTLNAKLEIEAQRKWIVLVRAEECFFLQRSRVLWLADVRSFQGP